MKKMSLEVCLDRTATNRRNDRLIVSILEKGLTGFLAQGRELDSPYCLYYRMHNKTCVPTFNSTITSNPILTTL